MPMLSRLRWLLVGALVWVGVLFSPVGVFAHAAYDHSTPARDEVAQAPPVQLDVFFKQEVFKQEGRNFVRVFNDDDTQVSAGDGTVDDDDHSHIVATLPNDLPDGRYVVRWMTTSDEDGDSDEGAFCFYVRVQPTAAQQAECASFEPTPAAGMTPTVASETPTESPAETPTVQPTGAASTPATSPTAAPPADGDDDGSNTGLIVGGIAVGVIVGVIVIGAVAIWLRRTLA